MGERMWRQEGRVGSDDGAWRGRGRAMPPRVWDRTERTHPRCASLSSSSSSSLLLLLSLSSWGRGEGEVVVVCLLRVRLFRQASHSG